MMSEDTHSDEPAGREAYYAAAGTWASDQVDEAARSRRTAWRITAGAATIAVLEALALVALAPLKTVVPYTILVDRNTGFAQALDGTTVPQVSQRSALTQSLLAQYVVARETFDINSVQDQYRKVALMSAEGARQDYLALMPGSNPDSPLNRNGRNSVVSARIESVVETAPGTAMVRFATERTVAGGAPPQREYWVTLIRYRFSGEPMALEDRLLNPLGFQVIHYRRDQEAPPQPVATASAEEAAATGSAGEGLAASAPSAPGASTPAIRGAVR